MKIAIQFVSVVHSVIQELDGRWTMDSFGIMYICRTNTYPVSLYAPRGLYGMHFRVPNLNRSNTQYFPAKMKFDIV